MEVTSPESKNQTITEYQSHGLQKRLGTNLLDRDGENMILNYECSSKP